MGGWALRDTTTRDSVGGSQAGREGPSCLAISLPTQSGPGKVKPHYYTGGSQTPGRVGGLAIPSNHVASSGRLGLGRESHLHMVWGGGQ